MPRIPQYQQQISAPEPFGVRVEDRYIPTSFSLAGAVPSRRSGNVSTITPMDAGNDDRAAREAQREAQKIKDGEDAIWAANTRSKFRLGLQEKLNAEPDATKHPQIANEYMIQYNDEVSKTVDPERSQIYRLYDARERDNILMPLVSAATTARKVAVVQTVSDTLDNDKRLVSVAPNGPTALMDAADGLVRFTDSVSRLDADNVYKANMLAKGKAELADAMVKRQLQLSPDLVIDATSDGESWLVKNADPDKINAYRSMAQEIINHRNSAIAQRDNSIASSVEAEMKNFQTIIDADGTVSPERFESAVSAASQVQDPIKRDELIRSANVLAFTQTVVKKTYSMTNKELEQLSNGDLTASPAFTGYEYKTKEEQASVKNAAVNSLKMRKDDPAKAGIRKVEDSLATLGDKSPYAKLPAGVAKWQAQADLGIPENQRNLFSLDEVSTFNQKFAQIADKPVAAVDELNKFYAGMEAQRSGFGVKAIREMSAQKGSFVREGSDLFVGSNDANAQNMFTYLYTPIEEKLVGKDKSVREDMIKTVMPLLNSFAPNTPEGNAERGRVARVFGHIGEAMHLGGNGVGQFKNKKAVLESATAFIKSTDDYQQQADGWYIRTPKSTNVPATGVAWVTRNKFDTIIGGYPVLTGGMPRDMWMQGAKNNIVAIAAGQEEVELYIKQFDGNWRPIKVDGGKKVIDGKEYIEEKNLRIPFTKFKEVWENSQREYQSAMSLNRGVNRVGFSGLMPSGEVRP